VTDALPDEPVTNTPPLTQKQFRAVLDWYMCSNPWPGDKLNHAIVTTWLDSLAKADGWSDWVDAYHRVPANV